MSTQLPDAFAHRIKEDLRAQGFESDIAVEQVPQTGRYRYYVTCDGFKKLSYSERQSLVWRIAEVRLSPEDQLRVSMILTLDASQQNAA